MSNKRKLVLGLLVVFTIVITGGWYAYHRTVTIVHNCYAVEWVAGMCINHMQAESGAWPKGWDDLQDDYEALTKASGRPWTFDELRSRVVVDWNADSKQLAALAKKSEPFRVLRLTDGTTSHWQGSEPNEMLAEYFRNPDSDSYAIR